MIRCIVLQIAEALVGEMAAADFSHSPTRTNEMTSAGVIHRRREDRLLPNLGTGKVVAEVPSEGQQMVVDAQQQALPTSWPPWSHP